MKKIEILCKQNALRGIYSDFPKDVDVNELWKSIMEYGVEDDAMVLREEYENKRPDEIRECLNLLFSNAKKLAQEVIDDVKKSTPKPGLLIEELISNYEDVKVVANSSAEAEKLKKEFYKNFKNEYLIVEKSV